jgi:acetylornithine deacetylase
MTDIGTATRERILAAVEDHLPKTVRLLQELIAASSVNPWFGAAPEISGEARVQDVLEARLRRLSAEIDRWDPDADALAKYAGTPGYHRNRNFTGRPNLVGRLGCHAGPSLMILGHADVVDAHEGWSVDPFAGVQRDGRVVGRGAVDMKGGVAAALGALEALATAGGSPSGTVLFASVVDEEAGGMGTLALVDRGYRADAAIVPEPTAMKIAPLCRGILWGRVTLHGRAGHIELAQPDWRAGGAVDAISYARRVLELFDHINEEWAREPRKRHPLLPLPCQVLVPVVHAGTYPTSWAESASITFNAQYLPAEQDENGLGGLVKAEIAQRLSQLSEQDEWLRLHPPELEWLVDADCGETSVDHPFVQTIVAAARDAGLPGQAEGLTCHTDMGLLIRAGIPTVNLGPGLPSVAHQANEWVAEEDLLQVSSAIALGIERWCGITWKPRL